MMPDYDDNISERYPTISTSLVGHGEEFVTAIEETRFSKGLLGLVKSRKFGKLELTCAT